MASIFKSLEGIFLGSCTYDTKAKECPFMQLLFFNEFLALGKRGNIYHCLIFN